jgi:MoaA/NifB/PqqE/SkfB family radical SAM enzyme
MFNYNVVLFSVTDHCNARCEFCSFWRKKGSGFPKKEAIKKITTDLKNKLNCKFLTITGGEPLTYPHVFDLLEGATGAGMITLLTTNGSLLNKDMILKLEKAGLKIIALSIDHYDESVVFKNRKIPDLLKKIEENIGLLKKANMIIQAGVTIGRHNVSDLRKITDFSLSIGVDELYFCLPMMSTESTYAIGSRFSKTIDLSKEEMIPVIDEIIKIKKLYKNKITHSLAFLKDIRNYYAGKKQKFPCKGGENIFYLDNHLDIYQCMTKNKKIGKIGEKITSLKNVECYECPLQCFREGSVYLYGSGSIPFYFEKIFNFKYWRLLRSSPVLK